MRTRGRNELEKNDCHTVWAREILRSFLFSSFLFLSISELVILLFCMDCTSEKLLCVNSQYTGSLPVDFTRKHRNQTWAASGQSIANLKECQRHETRASERVLWLPSNIYSQCCPFWRILISLRVTMWIAQNNSSVSESCDCWWYSHSSVQGEVIGGKVFLKRVWGSWHEPLFSYHFPFLLPGTCLQSWLEKRKEQKWRRKWFLWLRQGIHATMAEEKQTSVFLMTLWSQTQVQDSYLELFTTRESKILICLIHWFRSYLFIAEYNSNLFSLVAGGRILSSWCL